VTLPKGIVSACEGRKRLCPIEKKKAGHERVPYLLGEGKSLYQCDLTRDRGINRVSS